MQQLLYASPCVRGEPWYDFVPYCPTENPSYLSVAEARAIVRPSEGDIAVVADMDDVPDVATCPLVSRGCTRLAWSVPAGETYVRSRALPLASIRRVLRVVRELVDLVRFRGCDAEPAGRDDPVAERLAMRFFVNAFYPWGGGGE